MIMCFCLLVQKSHDVFRHGKRPLSGKQKAGTRATRRKRREVMMLASFSYVFPTTVSPLWDSHIQYYKTTFTTSKLSATKEVRTNRHQDFIRTASWSAADRTHGRHKRDHVDIQDGYHNDDEIKDQPAAVVDAR